MSFKLQKGKPLPRQVAAVFTEQVGKAVASITRYGPDHPEDLHAARKNLKRSRALLRLVRQPQSKPLCRQLNADLRGIAQSLSRNRDREVIIALLGQWSAEAAGAEPDEALAAACRRLSAFLQQSDQPVAGLEAGLRDSVLDQLAALGGRIGNLTATGLSRKDLRESAATAFMRLQAAFWAYRKAPDPIPFHDLRKRSKDHLYHRQLLKEVLSLKDSRTRLISQFEGLLGTVRDCDLLLEMVSRHWDAGLEPSQVASLIVKAETRKAVVLEEALQLGIRLLDGDQSEALSK